MINIRIWKELEKINQIPSDEYVAGPTSVDNLFEWQATVKGPEDSFYNKGIFKIKIIFPEEYPFLPPKINFVTKIYHPNISQETGYVCLNNIEKNWKPSYTIEKLLNEIINLLKYPSYEEYYEPVLAYELRVDPNQFKKVALEWVSTYAK